MIRYSLYISDERVQELIAYLKDVPCTSAQKLPHGAEVLDELVVTEIEKEITKVNNIPSLTSLLPSKLSTE